MGHIHKVLEGNVRRFLKRSWASDVCLTPRIHSTEQSFWMAIIFISLSSFFCWVKRVNISYLRCREEVCAITWWEKCWLIYSYHFISGEIMRGIGIKQFFSGKSYDAYSGRESPQPFDWTLHQESFRYTSLCRFYLAGRCERLMVKFLLAGFYSVFWWNLANLPTIFCIGRMDRLITVKTLEMKLDHLRYQYVVDWNKRLPFDVYFGDSADPPRVASWLQGGEDCHFAHDESQLREKPNLYRTHGVDLSHWWRSAQQTHQQALFRSH